MKVPFAIKFAWAVACGRGCGYLAIAVTSPAALLEYGPRAVAHLVPCAAFVMFVQWRRASR